MTAPALRTERLALRGHGIFAIEESGSATLVGYAGLWHPVDLDEPELCWGLFTGHHGKGYATEAAGHARNWAHSDLGLPPLMSFVRPDNLATQAVARRLGAKLEGETLLRGEGRLIFRHTAKPASSFNSERMSSNVA